VRFAPMDSSQWVSGYRFGQAFAVPFETEPQVEQPRRLAEILEKIPREVVERFSGCGSPIPEAIEGRRVLDLG
jgi:hypothetical protein